MFQVKNPQTKKAGLGRRPKRPAASIQRSIRYSSTMRSSIKFSLSSRKSPPKPASHLEERRQVVIRGLLAASTPAEREAIEKGRREGRELRKLAEVL